MNPQKIRTQFSAIYDQLNESMRAIEDSVYDAKSRKGTLKEVKEDLKELIHFIDILENQL